jgi:hypothetical protein
METRINLNIQGEVNLFINDKVIYKDNNSITGDSLQILMMSLAKVPIETHIDRIIVKGDFDDVITPITNSIFNATEGSITFIGKIETSQAIGTISELNLNTSTLDKNLATKVGMTVVKNSTVEIEIRWKITIINC